MIIAVNLKLFLFSELLTANRDKLKESLSFILTLQKDKPFGENTQQRINIRKILDLNEMIKNHMKMFLLN